MKKKKSRPKKTPIKQLKSKADNVFSKWIRTRDNAVCFTCGKILGIKESQNGHYMSRRHTNTRYDEDNCHCQCVSCNIFQNGNMQIYAIRLEEKYGQGILKELFRKAHTIKKAERKFYEDIIKKYAQT